LQELILDNDEPTPDDLALSEMIRHDMSAFSPSPWTRKRCKWCGFRLGWIREEKRLSICLTAKAISMTKEEAAKLLQRGLEKLRASYTSR
jgi:hypothetical protein